MKLAETMAYQVIVLAHTSVLVVHAHSGQNDHARSVFNVHEMISVFDSIHAGVSAPISRNLKLQ